MKLVPKLRKLILAILVAMILVLVFFAYLQPGFIVDLANRYVFC